MVRVLGLAAFGAAALTGHAVAEPVAVGTGRVILTAAQLARVVDGCCPKLPPDVGRFPALQERWERVETGVIEALAAAGRLPAATATATPAGSRGASASR